MATQYTLYMYMYMHYGEQNIERGAGRLVMPCYMYTPTRVPTTGW